MIDDILMSRASQQEHDQRIEQVLQRLEEARIKLNRKKCMFSANQVKFHEVMVSAQGISADLENVEALAKLPTPSDVSGVQRLQGMVNQVVRLIPHLSDITAPVRTLLQKRN